ncbi:VOC family protein [Streptomyces sp. NP-1717]|uniref:VOC family protein n=1 Tax=Streptomyces sp. NP-1717 TaxID=2704470 RepID=UPI001F5DC9C7|nr:VOC family protein [Streptomyces sp. NP-1717]MCI3220806.1 VOC family protein [Streptomyces sp. NP-1717]
MTEAAIRHRPGTPCWVSLMVHDLGAAQDFYGGLFGWKFVRVPGPEPLSAYVRGVLDGQEVAGIGQLPPERRLPLAWTTYLATDDADMTAEAVRCCGGTVGVGPLDTGVDGRVAIASDPAGAVFGIRQAQARAGAGSGFLESGAEAGPGAHGMPVRNELVTHEAAWAGTFYRSVFGYDVETTGRDGADVLTLRLDGHPVATLRGVGEGLERVRGSHWMTYFEVDDTDASALRVTELGGHVIDRPRETAAGRVATVTDPEGAVFSVVRSAAR